MSNKPFYEISIWKDIPKTGEKPFSSNEVVESDIIYHLETNGNEENRRLVFYNGMDGENVKYYYYSGVQKIENTDVQSNFIIQFSYLEETKSKIIGSSIMTYPGKAINPVISTSLNSSTLTFDMKKFFFNPETELWEENYFIPFLNDETKLKVKYKGEWNSFVIKNITETKSKKQITYSYTCNALFIEELAKTGWELVFDEGTNGIGTVDELGARVLEDSDWQYLPVENPNDFKETIDEYKKDENGNYLKDIYGNYILETKDVSTPKTEFNNDLKRVVTKYNLKNGTKEVYGYQTTEIITSEVAQNLATNNKDFMDTTGWIKQSSQITLGTELSFKDDTDPTKNIYSLAATKGTGVAGSIFNSGLSSRNIVYKSENPYIIKVVYCFDKYVSNSTQTGLNFNIDRIKLNENGSYDSVEAVYTSDIPITSGIYYVIKPSAQVSFIKPYLSFNFNGGKKLLIQDIQFFQLKPKDPSKQNIIDGWTDKQQISETILKENAVTPDSTPEAFIQEKMNYFIYNEKNEIEYIDNNLVNPEPIMVTGAQKVRTLTAEKSNRFNIMQDISELFECWMKPIIEYEENGKIKTDSFGRMIKRITFSKNVGKHNYSGFHYGTNLIDIAREIQNEEFVTKMFVEDNDCEYVEGGIVTIKNSKENISKEGFLLNFDYYVQIGELDKNSLTEDLYETSQTSFGIGYLSKLGNFNSEYEEKSEVGIGIFSTITSLTNQKTVLTLQIEAIKEQIKELQDEIDSTERPLTNSQKKDKKELIDRHKKNLSTYEENLATVQTQLDKYQADYDAIQERLEEIKKEKVNLHKIFNSKYSRFIHEGTWQDSNYLDDDKFYLDSIKTIKRSSEPKVSYTINVVELSSLPEFKNFTFQVGDVTYVTDEKFFGRDNTGKLIQQEVVVYQLDSNLDNPNENTITVQNYTTQFEDLFSRIAAAQQTIQFKEQTFSRSENFTPNGEINVSVLQSSLLNNTLILAQAKDQSVIINDKGIEVSDLFNMSKKIRIVSNGILLSKDGGLTWPTAITADGISASFITSGQIDVTKIRIMNGNFPTFSWDSNGITAFKIQDDGSALDNTFVRFDQHGVYMVNRDSDFIVDYTKPWSERVSYVRDNSLVSFTWDGFNLKTNDGSVDISSENDIRVLEQRADKTIERIQIGRTGERYLEKNPDYDPNNPESPEYLSFPEYGMIVKNAVGEEVFKTTGDGNLLLSKSLFINNGESNELIGIGAVENNEDRVIWIDIQNGDNKEEIFSVNKLGHLFAKDAYIEGNIVATSGSFTGNIYGDMGYFKSTFLIGENVDTYGDLLFDISVSGNTTVLTAKSDQELEVNKNYGQSGIKEIRTFYRTNKPLNTAMPNLTVTSVREEVSAEDSTDFKLYITIDSSQDPSLLKNGDFVGDILGLGTYRYYQVFIDENLEYYLDPLYNYTSGSFAPNSKIYLLGDAYQDVELTIYDSKNFVSTLKEDSDSIDNIVVNEVIPHLDELLTDPKNLDINVNYYSKILKSGINGDGTFPYAFWINNNTFTVSHGGILTATGANISGNINAVSGMISGEMKVGEMIFDGINGRIIAGDFYLNDNGEVYANSITIGSKGQIADYMKFSEYAAIFNPIKYNGSFIIADENEIPFLIETFADDDYNFHLKNTGELITKKLLITGSGSKINGTVTIGPDNGDKITIQDGNIFSGVNANDIANGWIISNSGNAIFNNVSIRGKLESTVFEYNNIQAVSGTLIIRPSAIILTAQEELNSDGKVTRIKIEIDGDPSLFNDTDYVFIDFIRFKNYYRVQKIATPDENVELYLLPPDVAATPMEPLGSDYVNKIIINMGLPGQKPIGISINSTMSEAVASPEAIAIYEFKELKENPIAGTINYSVENEIKLLMGLIPAGLPGYEGMEIVPNEYGFYSDNVYLKGAMLSSTTVYDDDGNPHIVTSGINTKAENTIIWAGAMDGNADIAKFRVDKDGSVYAEDGFFRGTIVTTDAEISGTITGDGLKVESGSNGLFFMNDIDGDKSTPSIISATINKDGVYLWSGADLRIYKENFSDDVPPVPPINAIPYIFSNDKNEFLSSRKLVVNSNVGISDNPIITGVTIGENSIIFGYSDKLLDYNNFEDKVGTLINQNINLAKIESKYKIENGALIADKFSIVGMGRELDFQNATIYTENMTSDIETINRRLNLGANTFLEVKTKWVNLVVH